MNKYNKQARELRYLDNQNVASPAPFFIYSKQNRRRDVTACPRFKRFESAGGRRRGRARIGVERRNTQDKREGETAKILHTYSLTQIHTYIN